MALSPQLQTQPSEAFLPPLCLLRPALLCRASLVGFCTLSPAGHAHPSLRGLPGHTSGKDHTWSLECIALRAANPRHRSLSSAQRPPSLVSSSRPWTVLSCPVSLGPDVHSPLSRRPGTVEGLVLPRTHTACFVPSPANSPKRHPAWGREEAAEGRAQVSWVEPMATARGARGNPALWNRALLTAAQGRLAVRRGFQGLMRPLSLAAGAPHSVQLRAVALV